jgi:hypothetical protein
MSAKTLGLLAATLLATTTVAPAATIVDTGEVDAGTSQVYTFRSFRAGQFTLGQSTTITSVEHWTEALASGTGQLSIWTDTNGLPGAAIAGYEAFFAVTQGGPRWYGRNDVSWLLGPGTYWLVRNPVFGLAETAQFNTPLCLPSDNGIGCSIANPLGSEATRVDGVWALGSARSGWRIQSTDVPEPGALALFSLGLLGLGLAGRRRYA